MARRTKAQIRAERIAAIEARRKEENALLRELKREAAKDAKAEFDAAVLDLGRWLAGEVEARSLEQVAALRQALDNAKTLRSIRDKVAAGTADAAPVDGGVFDDEPAASTPDGDAGGDTRGSTEADTSEQGEDEDGEERSSFKPW